MDGSLAGERTTGRGPNKRVHGGAEGGLIQRVALNMERQMVSQCPNRTALHGGRSHGGRQPDDTMATTGGKGDIGGGAHRIAGEPMKRSDPDDVGGHDGASAMTPRGGSRDPEQPRAEMKLKEGRS